MFLRTGVAVVLFFCVMVHSGVPHTEKAEKTLIQVHTIFRHGESAPEVSFPKDSNHSEQNWENGFRQLTKEGIEQHFNLGRFFRHRYSDFLSPNLKYDEIKVLSSEQDRCLNSAAANTAGLYYDSLLVNKTKMFESGLSWSPVPIHTVPSDMDYFIDVERSCEKLKKLIDDSEWDIQKHSADAKPMLTELEQKYDLTISNILEVAFIYDHFNLQRLRNRNIPDFVKPMMPKLKEFQRLSYELLGKTDASNRLYSGSIISKILNEFQAKVDSPPTTPKMFMYSGYDSTVAGNLKALGWFNGIKPPFASAVIYELHQTEDRENYVKIFYQNDTSFSSQLHEIFLPDCFNNCSLHQFRTMMTPLIPGDNQEECVIVTYLKYSVIGIAYILFCILLLICQMPSTEEAEKLFPVLSNKDIEIGSMYYSHKNSHLYSNQGSEVQRY